MHDSSCINISIVLYCIVLYCIVLYCIVLYCIVLYFIVLYCIVLYCIVLYGIVLSANKQTYFSKTRGKLFSLAISATDIKGGQVCTL